MTMAVMIFQAGAKYSQYYSCHASIHDTQFYIRENDMRYLAILFMFPNYIDAANMDAYLYRPWTAKWDCLATDIREGTCGIIVKKIKW